MNLIRDKEQFYYTRSIVLKVPVIIKKIKMIIEIEAKIMDCLGENFNDCARTKAMSECNTDVIVNRKYG